MEKRLQEEPERSKKTARGTRKDEMHCREKLERTQQKNCWEEPERRKKTAGRNQRGGRRLQEGTREEEEDCRKEPEGRKKTAGRN